MARIMARYDVLMLMTKQNKQSTSRLSQFLFILKRRGSLDIAGGETAAWLWRRQWENVYI